MNAPVNAPVSDALQDADVEIPGAAVVPIAQALVAAVQQNGSVDIDDLPEQARLAFMDKAAQLLALAVPHLGPRVRFNITLVARIRALPNDAILAITQPPVNATLETRRAMLVRAIRLEK